MAQEDLDGPQVGAGLEQMGGEAVPQGMDDDPFGQPGDLVSQDYPFVHPSKPLVAYNCLKHHFSVDAQGEERHSADWDSLNLYSLESEAEVESKPRVPVTKPPEVVSEAGIVYVVGDVHAPTGVVMEDTGPITVLKALAMAEGANPTANLRNAKIIRKDENGTTKVPVDITKISTELGYRSRVPFEEGLARTVQWYRDNRSWWEPLKESAALPER